jgi:kynurenine formamidase
VALFDLLTASSKNGEYLMIAIYFSGGNGSPIRAFAS